MDIGNHARCFIHTSCDIIDVLEMNKIIIAGGRDFNDYDLLKKEAAAFLFEIENGEAQIVSGGAKGVDAMGERFAQENNIEVVLFPADWKKYGRAAGPKRNAQMAEYATHLLSFWNGESKGTKSMITLAKKNNLMVKVISV